MQFKFYFFLLTFSLSSGLVFAQSKTDPGKKIKPQLKTQVIIRSGDDTGAIRFKHPASRQLTSSQERNYPKTVQPPPSPDDLIRSYQRKLDSLTEEQRLENPGLADKLKQLINQAEAGKNATRRADDDQ